MVEPLRALGPEKDTCGALPYAQITEIYQDVSGGPRHFHELVQQSG
ncbi:hypothetical protein [Nonomuraea deserti]|nr:hypothetical protein [Nonomuraea deserti]